MIHAPTRILIIVIGLAFPPLYAAPVPIATAPDTGEKASRPRVALVLEGGAALGLAHIGVIEVIEELGIPVDIVVGTSMGAIVGGLYATGYDAQSLKQIVADIDWQDLFSENSASRDDPYPIKRDRSRYFASVGFDGSGVKGSGGLLSGKKILTYMDCLTLAIPSPVDFDTLSRRFRAVAADISARESVVIRDGSLSDAMRASMSIPGVFAPFRIDDRYLMDGGIVDNLPVDIARSMGADIIIAVDLLGGFASSRDIMDRTPLEYLTRVMDIMVRSNVLEQLPGADCIIEVDLRDFTAMDFSKSDMIIAQGMMAARDSIAALERVRDSLGADFETQVMAPSYEPFSSLLVLGGAAQDQSAARLRLSPMIDKEYGGADMIANIMRLYRERSLDSLRVRRTGSEGTMLEVSLEPRGSPSNTMRLGINYAGTYSSRVSSRMIVTPSIQLKDWPLPGSGLSMNLELMNTLRMEASIDHTWATDFFLGADMVFRHDFETLSAPTVSTASVDYIFYRTTASMTAQAGFLPFPGALVSIGLSRDWNLDTLGLDFLADLLANNVTTVRVDASILRTSPAIFTTTGIAMDLNFTQGIQALGAASVFGTVETKGAIYLPMGTFTTSGLLWKAGADLSGTTDGWNSAPLAYKPTLADRRLFPALLTVDEQIGAYVAGVGIELKILTAQLSRILGLPTYAVARMASGGVIRNTGIFENDAPAHYWSADVGAGVRFSDGFGLLFRCGGAGRFDGSVTPYFAVDVGALGYELY